MHSKFSVFSSRQKKSSSSKSDANQAQKTHKKKQTLKRVNQVIKLISTPNDSPMRFDIYQNLEPTDEHYVTRVLDGDTHRFMIRAVKTIECQNSQAGHDMQKGFQSDKKKRNYSPCSLIKSRNCSDDNCDHTLERGSLLDMADTPSQRGSYQKGFN